VTLSKLTALGQDRTNFPVFGHVLPSGVAVDGLLGLDFVRSGELNINFRTGQIALT
jgi:hypothetical protein